MKRYLYIFIVMVITSCAESTLQEEVSNYVDVSFSTCTSTIYIDDMQSRSEEESPTTASHHVRYVVEAWSQGESPELYYRSVERVESVESSLNHTIHIIEGTYDFLFWADYIEADADTTEDYHYDTSNGLTSVAIKNAAYTANDLSRDCFATCKKDITISSSTNLGTIELTRPMTMLVVKNSDSESVEDGKDISITTVEAIPSGYNVLSNEVICDKTIRPSYGATTAGEEEMAFDYIFISEPTLYNVTINVGEIEKTSNSTPFEVNKKTNIIATFF